MEAPLVLMRGRSGRAGRRRLLPRTARYGDDVTLEQLVAQARRFELTGARIRSAITRAAYLAAARGAACIANDDLQRAAAAELEDMGRVLPSGKPRALPRLIG